MHLLLSYTESDAVYLSDVIKRINVLYPDLEIQNENYNIFIAAEDEAFRSEVKQVILDQFIRSKFDETNRDLRNYLYHKLLK